MLLKLWPAYFMNDLVKIQILILWVWSWPWGSILLTSSQMMLVLMVKWGGLTTCIICYFLLHRWFHCLLDCAAFIDSVWSPASLVCPLYFCHSPSSHQDFSCFIHVLFWIWAALLHIFSTSYSLFFYFKCFIALVYLFIFK